MYLCGLYMVGVSSGHRDLVTSCIASNINTLTRLLSHTPIVYLKRLGQRTAKLGRFQHIDHIITM